MENWLVINHQPLSGKSDWSWPDGAQEWGVGPVGPQRERISGAGRDALGQGLIPSGRCPRAGGAARSPPARRARLDVGAAAARRGHPPSASR